jgi:hypothetical protein
MSAKGLYFTYPTIGHGDDVRGKFGCSLTYEYKQGSDNVDLQFRFDLENEEMQALIDGGSAAYGIELECSSTFLRLTEQTSQASFKIEVPESRLRGKVTVAVFIFTLETLNYKLASFHKDFGNEGFLVPSGYYIGWWGTTSFFADKTFDPLRAAASSFIKVRKHIKDNDFLETTYEEDIIIHLPEMVWNKYKDLKIHKTVHPILHTSLVLPVLVEAINAIHDGNKDMHNDKLEEILKTRNLMEVSPYIAAQSLLLKPLDRTMLSVESLIDMGEGDTQ